MLGPTVRHFCIDLVGQSYAEIVLTKELTVILAYGGISTHIHTHTRTERSQGLANPSSLTVSPQL